MVRAGAKRGGGGVAWILALCLLWPAQALGVAEPTSLSVSPSATNEIASWSSSDFTVWSFKIYRSRLQRDGTFTTEALVGTNAGNPPSYPVQTYLDLSVSPTNTYRYSVAACTGTNGDGTCSTHTVQKAGVVPPFRYDSPWNATVASTSTLSSTQLADLGTNDKLDLSGAKPQSSSNCGVPTWFAETGDPAVSSISGNTSWWGTGAFAPTTPMPVPVGSYVEGCGDGHVQVINAARTRAWGFWNVSTWDSDSSPTVAVGGGGNGVAESYDLTGDGVADESGASMAARESGVPLIDTAIRPEEVAHGIKHAIGITLPGGASSSWVCPASKGNDGGPGTTHLMYGQRVALRPDFPETGLSSGELNIVRALKAYGAYVTDDGGVNLEIDAFSPVDPAGYYVSTGVAENSFTDGSHDITSTDFRLVTSPTC